MQIIPSIEINGVKLTKGKIIGCIDKYMQLMLVENIPAYPALEVVNLMDNFARNGRSILQYWGDFWTLDGRQLDGVILKGCSLSLAQMYNKKVDDYRSLMCA